MQLDDLAAPPLRIRAIKRARCNPARNTGSPRTVGIVKCRLMRKKSHYSGERAGKPLILAL